MKNHRSTHSAADLLVERAALRNAVVELLNMKLDPNDDIVVRDTSVEWRLVNGGDFGDVEKWYSVWVSGRQRSRMEKLNASCAGTSIADVLVVVEEEVMKVRARTCTGKRTSSGRRTR